MLRQSITRNSWLLAMFAVTTTLLIASTYLLTKDRIGQEKRKAEEKALLEIVPRERHDNSMLDDVIAVGPEANGLGLASEKRIYLARRGDQVVAAIIPVTAPDGYTGDIDLIVGVNADGTIAGVRALSHKETPGLGDKVDYKKSKWVLGFNGRSLGNPDLAGWAVKKDKGVFDQFTGATITPRAVVAATLRALQYAAANSKTLFGSRVDTSSVDTSGVDTSGVDTSGVDTSGVDTSGVDTSGVDTSRTDQSGEDTHGANAPPGEGG